MASVCIPNNEGNCIQCEIPLKTGLIRTCKRRSEFDHINSHEYLNKSLPEVSSIKPRKGIGTLVAFLLSKFGIKKKPQCGCYQREQKLNHWGWWAWAFVMKTYQYSLRPFRYKAQQRRALEAHKVAKDLRRQILLEQQTNQPT